ncbi:hypothetical protein BT69DRAFT_1283250 [Atractiella rhizophila]|nr:hypothetical protein BT69DRAFT_1283250 [Atractiella rhizophila]
MKVHQELFHLRELVVEILREKKEKFKVLESGFGEKEKEWEVRREELEAELQDNKDQLEKANEMVEAFISAESLHGHPALANGLPNGKDHDLGDETTDGIEDEMVRQRRLLEEERQKFTEAAVRLGKERGEFEAERIAFYEERRKLQVQLMLSDLPETPLSAKAPAPAEEGTKPSRRVSIASPLIAKRAKSPPPIAVPKTTNSRLKNILAMATDSQDVPTLPDSPEPIPTKEKAKEKVKEKEKEKEKEKVRRPTITSKPSASSTHTTTVVQSRRVGSTSAATSPPPVRKSTSPVAPAEKLSKPLDKGPTKPLVLSSGEERKGLQMRKRSNSTSAPPTREVTNPIRSRKVSVGPGVSVREKETANGASKIGGLKRSSSMKVSTSTTSAAAPEKAKEGTRSRKDSTHARAATVSSSTVPKKAGEEKNATETRARKTSTVGRSASTSISLKTEKDKEKEKEKEKRSVSGTVSASERVRALVKKATEKSG